MMEKKQTRKVQFTGGSTYIVSLPVDWIREMDIQQGDELFFSRQQDNSLAISPKKKPRNDFNSTTIIVDPADKKVDILRLLISHYLVGYDKLKLVFNGKYAADDRKWIKESVRKRLIALEVVEESSDWVMFQSLLNYNQFPLNKAMSNILRIVRSMQNDSKKALLELDRNVASEVIQRDIEVDRFYLLIVRQLKAVLRNPELASDLGLANVRECLGYRLVVKNVERIADHAENVAKFSLKITRINPEIHDLISSIYELNEIIFNNIIECLEGKDRNIVNKIIDDSQRSIALGRELDEMILNDDNLSGRIFLNSVSESLKRMAGYSADISEVILNMSVKEPDLNT
ncbi:MAG: PhoU domain-containing protein [ANME-2 cluster archaeon]|nr:PhoU domain-containing protein [ANME-2 cluster archaeon]